MAISKKIRDPGREALELDEARAIIGALKQPYRAMFEAALYSGMGRNELLALNEFWAKIRPQLLAGKEIVEIDFGRRKNNPQPYYTFLPRRILEPFKDKEENPFVTRTGEPVAEGDLGYTWKYAKKRVGITRPVKPHHIRDLFRTLAVKAGVQADCAEFLMGHQIDELRYNQIYRDREFILKEWSKLRDYLDTGVSTEYEARTKDLVARLEERISHLEGLLEIKKGAEKLGSTVEVRAVKNHERMIIRVPKPSAEKK